MIIAGFRENARRKIHISGIILEEGRATVNSFLPAGEGELSPARDYWGKGKEETNLEERKNTAAEEELLDRAAEEILARFKPAFEELAK